MSACGNGWRGLQIWTTCCAGSGIANGRKDGYSEARPVRKLREVRE